MIVMVHHFHHSLRIDIYISIRTTSYIKILPQSVVDYAPVTIHHRFTPVHHSQCVLGIAECSARRGSNLPPQGRHPRRSLGQLYPSPSCPASVRAKARAESAAEPTCQCSKATISEASAEGIAESADVKPTPRICQTPLIAVSLTEGNARRNDS